MINVSKAKAMPKGWLNALKVDVMNDLNALGNDDGYANGKLSSKLYKHDISDSVVVTKQDLQILLRAIA